MPWHWQLTTTDNMTLAKWPKQSVVMKRRVILGLRMCSRHTNRPMVFLNWFNQMDPIVNGLSSNPPIVTVLWPPQSHRNNTVII